MSGIRRTPQGPGRLRGPARESLLRLALLALSVGLGLAVVEAGVRMLGLAPALPEEYRGFIEDPFLPFRGKPFHTHAGTSAGGEFEFEYTTNSEGFRDREHAFEKTDDRFRILVLGDSFAWGVGAPMERAFPARLEQLLNEREDRARKVEVINLGMIRYFPKIERIALEHYGIRYAPDLVIVAFVANDVRDTALGLDALRSSPEGYLISRRGQRLGRIGLLLYVHSHTARTLLSRYLARSEVGRREARARPFTRAEQERAWLEIEREFARMGEISKARGADLVAVHIPPASLFPNTSRRLAKHVGSHVAALIDTTSALADTRIRTGRFLYWPKDGHCDAHGYEVIAQNLARDLTRLGLVP